MQCEVTSRAILDNIAGYGLCCAVVGCVLGARVGVFGGGIYAYMARVPRENGPALMVFTGPIGFVCGILYGIWTEYV